MNNIAFKQLELETLLEITNTLIEHEDVDDLLQDILIRTCGILDASCGFVLIEEKNSDLFVPKAVFNLDENVLSKIIFNKKSTVVIHPKTINCRIKDASPILKTFKI